MSRPSSLTPYLAVLLAIVIFSTTGPLIKIIAYPSLLLTFIRCAVPALVAASLLVSSKDNSSLKLDRIALASSALNAFRMYCFIAALSYTSVTNGIVVAYTSPIFSIIFARIILKEPIHLPGILGVLLATSGIVIIYGHALTLSGSHLIGISIMLTSAFVYGLVNVLNKLDLNASSATEVLYRQSIVGAILFAPAAFLCDVPHSLSTFAMSIGYAFCIGHIGFWLLFLGLKQLSVLSLVLFSYLEVVFAVLIAIFYLGEALETQTWIGCLFILTGSLLTRLLRKKPVITHS